MRPALAVLLAAGFLAAPASSSAKTPDQYRAEIAKLKDQRRYYKTVAETTIIERDKLAAQNRALLSGLPAAITAVPLDQFSALVFAPARQAWPCDDSFSGQSFSSITFYSTSFCS